MLPPLFARWMEGLLGAAVPEEHEATCSSCAMQTPRDATRTSRTAFGDSKCCTWQPALHSFLAGAVLLDGAPELARGRAVLDGLIDRRAGVSPLGVHGPSSFWLVYDNATDAFGRADSLRCPFFLSEGGTCGIWRHRESTCSTWFCKHDRAAVGHAFWRALHQLLMSAEFALVRHVALELDVGDTALAVLFPTQGLQRVLPGESVNGTVDDEAYRARWGPWLGRERAYFEEAARIVAALAWPEVLALMGADGQVFARRLAAELARVVDRSVPKGPLEMGHVDLVSSRGGVVRLRTYRDYDLIELPQAMLGALARFDGRPTDVVLREVAKQGGVTLGPDVLRTLCDFQVLVPAGRAE